MVEEISCRPFTKGIEKEFWVSRVSPKLAEKNHRHVQHLGYQAHSVFYVSRQYEYSTHSLQGSGVAGTVDAPKDLMGTVAGEKVRNREHMVKKMLLL